MLTQMILRPSACSEIQNGDSVRDRRAFPMPSIGARFCVRTDPTTLPSIRSILFGRRHLRQAGHGHDVAADHDDELGAGGEPHLAHVDHVVRRRAAQPRVGGERVLGLGHAHRVVAVAVVLQLLDLGAHLGVRRDLGGAVDLLRDLVDLVPERVRVLVDEGRLGRLVAQARPRCCASSAAPLPPSPQWVASTTGTPSFFILAFSSSTSAGVSLLKWLIETTQGMP